MRSTRPLSFKSFELLALVLTVVLKFILMDRLGMRAFFISGMCLFWFGYVIYRYSRDRSILKYWGFKKENFGHSLNVLLPFLVISICISFLYAKMKDTPILNLNIIPVLILYPVFGIIQQFMLLCILTQNLQNTGYFSTRKYLLIFVVSLLFSLIHFPGLFLMGFTFIMEIIFLTVYLKWRNLWAIGLTHGIVATFLLHYILDRDLWTELFAWF